MYLLLFLILALLAVLGYKIKRMHSHWNEMGLPQDGLWETVKDVYRMFAGKRTILEFVDSGYVKFPGLKVYGGYNFGTPVLTIKDPEIIRQMTVKDFNHFTDHVNFMGGENEPLWQRNLLSLKGERWRYMRATLSPSFTSSKMKAMFHLMSECAEQVALHFERKQTDIVEVELQDLFRRYTNDVIATCSFGITVNSLEDRDNEFYRMGKEVSNFSGFWKTIKFILMSGFPKLCEYANITFFDKQVNDFFIKIVAETVQMREEKGIVRPDMIQLLMEARKGNLKFDEDKETSKETGFATVEESDIGRSTNVDHEITMIDMTAQALIFFLAGFDTASVVMSFMGYEFAVNPDIQERLKDEVDETSRKCGGKLSYDALNKMKYLDMVISETLRKWPPGIGIDRVCTAPYTLQADNRTINLSKGDMIWAPTYSIQNDPKFYPNPQRFDPERFSDENKNSIDPNTYYPFGSGPRSCIGSRFALLETKIVFYHLLSRFEFEAVKKTPIPMKLSKYAMQLQPEDGFWVGLKRRNN